MQVITKDLLTVEKGILVHQVNSLGVMGAGIALAIRTKWPQVYNRYVEITPAWGHIQIVPVGTDLYVCNLCAQDRVDGPLPRTDYKAFYTCLETLKIRNYDTNLPIYFPCGIGCGLAGGDWTIIRALINMILPDAIICRPPKEISDARF